jgi:hypothetical protein
MIIAAALAVAAGQLQPASAAELPLTLVLPAGTPIRLATVGPISSRSVVQGQRFALEVVEDVRAGQNLVIPRGTPATGEVADISGKGMLGKAARLVIQPLFVELAGKRVNLVGDSEHRGKDATVAAAAVTLLTPFGLFITGKTAVIPVGAPLFARVRSDVSLHQR